jgi:sarcosine oxidase
MQTPLSSRRTAAKDTMPPSPDIAVIGLGAVGGAILMQLAERGVPAIGLDRFAPPHAQGSSHGETRITRLSVGEGEAYAPLVRRSHEIWRALEAATGTTLLVETGGLVMAPKHGAAQHHGTGNFVMRSAEVARRFKIPHAVLDATEIGRRFPQFLLRGDEVAFFEPGAGMLRPEACVAAQLQRAAALGASIATDETVRELRETGAGVLITTARRQFEVARAVVAAGAWLPRLLGGDFARLAVPYRQALHWFTPDAPAEYAPGKFPVFIWMHGDAPEDYLYGFPTAGTPEVKLATEQYGVVADPDTMDRTVAPAESAVMFDRHVQGRLRGIAPVARRAAACLYTVTPDAGFIVDAVPGMKRVLAVSACSGHGFKHAAALGEAVAQHVVAGRSDITLAPFALARLGTTG